MTKLNRKSILLGALISVLPLASAQAEWLDFMDDFSLPDIPEFADLRAVNYDLMINQGQDGSGYGFGLTYHPWHQYNIEFTARLQKLDGIDYRQKGQNYHHNYGLFSAGVKYNYAYNPMLTLSPEIGLTYSVLDYRGASLGNADKGWYIGGEVTYHLNREFDIFFGSHFQQKNFAFDDEAIFSLGLRYKPFSQSSDRHYYNKSKSSGNWYGNGQSNRQSMSQPQPRQQMAQQQPSQQRQQQSQMQTATVPMQRAIPKAKKTQSTQQAGSTKSYSQLAQATPKQAQHQMPKLERTTSTAMAKTNLQIGAFKMRQSIQPFMRKYGLTESDIRVQQEGSWFRVYLTNPSKINGFSSKRHKTTSKTYVDLG